MMDIDQPEIKLESSDRKLFVLTGPEASGIRPIRVKLEHTPNSTSDVIHFDSIDGVTLAKVVDWCKMHPIHEDDEGDTICDPSYTGPPRVSGPLEEWEENFFKPMRTEQQLLKLLRVANYLELDSLFDRICQRIARRWEGKRVEEIRKQYRIHCDYSDEEEQLMKLEYKRLGLSEE